MRVTPINTATVHGFVHEPSAPTGAGIVLTHGAGGNCNSKLLVAVASGFAQAGFVVIRCDLAFRRRRAFGPPSPHLAALDRSSLHDALDELREMAPGPRFLGGHSYGGRQASMLAAESTEVAKGLLLLSYPLHPPKKPDQLRTGHFADWRTPALFVNGTKDPFGTVEEMKDALRLIPARTRLVTIDGAGHDLATDQFDIQSVVADLVKLVE
ncbi:MAG TPA: alpha/beta fold hydrolase [Bryobacteraceae bacterium]|nr:alpha/beta fold hydrolase [Bryobacteraceae bacterium]